MIPKFLLEFKFYRSTHSSEVQGSLELRRWRLCTSPHGRRLCPWCPHPTASLSGSWASGLDAGPTPHGGRLCPGGSGGPGGGSCPSLEGSQARTWKNLSKPLDQESSWEPLGTWTEASEQVGPLSRQTHCLAMALRRAGPRLHPRPCPHHQGAQAPEEQHL